MEHVLIALGQHTSAALYGAVNSLVWPGVVFGTLAVLTKGRALVSAVLRATIETRVNLLLCFFDQLFVAPLMLIVATAMSDIAGYGLALPESVWGGLGTYGTVLAAIFLGDFVGYWRHRFEHSRWIWPAHAIHHSDSEMTWLTIFRFHPVNRFTTVAIDSGCLALLGLPAWAIVAGTTVRHYYGQFIHADLPWTLGPLSCVLVSPAMHRWHHARDVKAANFASVFSVFDRVFGTRYVPGPCDAPLGVSEHMGRGATGQLMHPLLVWTRSRKLA